MRTTPLLALALLACHAEGPDGTPGTPTGTLPTGTPTGTATGTGTGTGTTPTVTPDTEPLELPPTHLVEGDVFATGLACADCHSNDANADAMRTAAGDPVGMVDLWEGTMMANSARDPLWRAVVSAEVAAVPSQQAAIEAKCTRCHAPMGNEEAQLDGRAPEMAMLLGDDEVGHLSRDGVSCAMCHQIADQDLGTEGSFSGGWVVTGAAEIYGPHGNLHSMPMEQHTIYTPVQSDHVNESELCATCHTLETHAMALDGVETGGSVMEQGLYLEWLASDHTGTSCQDCHLPKEDASGTPISTAIARSPNGGDMGAVSPRTPYGQHVLVGGNTLVPQMLRDWPALLQPTAPPEAFDAVIAAARDQLEHRTAEVDLDAQRAGDQLDVAVTLTNLTGHKLPSGVPVRRAWVALTVTDASGALVFRSGATDASGTLVDAADVPLASEAAGGPLQPHHELVTTSDQVHVYEAVLADGAGNHTFRLLAGEGWAKDNRLLPTGWTNPDPRIVPVGTGADVDFGPGGDIARYQVDLAGATGPFTVEAALHFQPLSTRVAQEVVAAGTPETDAFSVLWAAADRTPETLGSEVVNVP